MADYFATYADFDTASKKDSGLLLGADNIVGDIYDVVVEMEDGVAKAWLDNRFDQRIGFFDLEVSRRINLAKADGLTCKAILSFVAFSNHPGEGHYWGSAAVICYNPAYEEEFSNFITGLSAKIGDDIRPRIDFDKEAVEKIIDSNGEWLPSQTIPLPDVNKGMAIIKRRRKMTDKLIEQGRSRNIGCYIVSWAFLLGLVAVIIFGLKSCFGF